MTSHHDFMTKYGVLMISCVFGNQKDTNHSLLQGVASPALRHLERC